ncbi:uncharacterized protein PFB0145c isoform X2 [Cephus cinctus]|nr:uncharacterized protein PFB0145c isoform X2 [Cephus cinctus]XP_024939527.1 uncharacterized protein PFB0145c isoform X2 [Cephus cinctus]
MESGASEPSRILRSRKNSVTSDVSEVSDLQSHVGTPQKRSTRRSLTAQIADSPESTVHAKRSLRAGSESKSTPPVVRARRTRASSVESEHPIDTLLKKESDSQSTTVPTNTKTRRRASVMPSEPVLAEEAEEVKSAIPEVSDSVTSKHDESDNLSSSSIKKTSKSMSANTSLEAVDEEMPVEESLAKDSVFESSEKSLSLRDEASPSDVSPADTKLTTPTMSDHSIPIETIVEVQTTVMETIVNNKGISATPPKRHSLTLKETSKELGLKIESLLNKSTGKQETSPGNKENEKGNVTDIKFERNLETITNVVSTGKKSLRSLLETPSKEKHNLSADDRLLSNISEFQNTPEETVTVRKSFDNSEQTDSAKSKILTRRHSLKNSATEKESSNLSSQKIESHSEPMEVDEITVENLNDLSNDKVTFQEIENVVLKDAFVKLDKMELDGERTNENDEDSEPVKLQQNLNEVSEMEKLEIDADPEDMSAVSSEPLSAIMKSNTVCQLREKFLTNLESKTISSRRTVGEVVQEHSTDSQQKRLSLNISDLESGSPINKSELPENIQEDDVEIPKDASTQKESPTKDTTAELNEYVTDCSMSDTISIRNISFDPNEKSSVTDSPIRMNESCKGDEILCTIKNTNSSIVPDSTRGLTQGESVKEVETSVSTTSKSPSKTTEKTAKSSFVTSPQVDNKKSKRTQGVNVDDSDLDSNIGNLFQDIPADEWEKVKNKKLVEYESCSIHSVSTERLENESEAECDLILVDRDAWHAAETEKLVRKNQKFDYDSDDTIIMKTRMLESELKKGEKQTQLEIVPEEEPMEVVSEDEASKTADNQSSAKKQLTKECTEILNSSKRKSVGRRKSSTNTENDGSDSVFVNDDTNALNNRKSLNKSGDSSGVLNTSNKSDKTAFSKNKSIVMENDDDSDDELIMNSSQEDSSIDRKSLIKLRDSLNISKKSLNKSVDLNLSKSSKNNPENESSDVFTHKFLNRKPINNTIEVNSTSSSDDEPFVLEDVSDDESNEANISSRKSLSNRRSLNTSKKQKSTSRIEEQQNNDEEFSSNLTDESSVALKSLNKSRECETVDEKIDEQETSCNSSCNVNVSSRKSADLRRSLNRSSNAMSLESSKNQDQGNKTSNNTPENVKSFSRKSTETRKSLNTSQQNLSKKLIAEEAVIMMDTGSDNEEGKEVEEMEQSMQTSTAEMKSRNSLKNVSVGKKTKRLIEFNEEESSDNDISAKFSEDDSNDNVEQNNKSKNTSLKMISGKTASFKRNYSTLARYGSDLESGSNSDECDKQIPSFLFNESTSKDEDDTENSMDLDIAREMNLNGDTSLKYSDDDVPADDCRASESESSDSNDNGSDLADFVVGDDEIVEDEEDMEEETDEDSINEEEDMLEEPSNDQKKKKYNRISLPVDSENEDDNTESEDVHKEQEEDSEAEVEQVSKSRLSMDKNISKSSNKNKTLDEPEEIIESKIDLEQSRKSLTKKHRKSLSSIECSTPISTSAKEKTNEKRANQLTPNDSLLDIVATEVGFAKKKSLSAQTLADVKTPIKSASNSKDKDVPSFKTLKALQQSLPIDPPEITEATNLSRKKSLKVDTLNKSMATPNSETPLTKYLKKQKLNESLPADVGDEKLRKLKRKSMIQQRRSLVTMEGKDGTEVDSKKSNAEEAMDEAEDVLDIDLEKQKGSQIQEMVIVSKDEEIEEEIVTEKPVHSNKSKIAIRKERKKLAKKLSRTSSLEQAETEDSAEPKEYNEKQDVKTVNSTTNEDSRITKRSKVVAEESGKLKKKSNKKKQKSEVSQEIEQESLSNEALENIETRESVDEEGVASVQKSNKKQKKKKKNKSLPEAISANENEGPSEESLVHNNKKERKRKLKEAAESAQPEVEAKTKLKNVDKIVVEESTSKKRTKKQRQVLKSQEIEIQKKDSAVDSSSDASDAPESIGFAKARQAAVLEMKNVAESVKAGKEAKKKKNVKHNKKVEHDQHMKVEELEKVEKVYPAKQNLKRLPDDVIENISDVPTRPQKRRKILKKEEKILPSRSMFSPSKPSSCHIKTKDIFIPLSSSGGTTQFQVASLEKIKKNQKKVAASLFRERMLNRNRRQQVSAYLMYHQKLKASGKDKFPKPA